MKHLLIISILLVTLCVEGRASSIIKVGPNQFTLSVSQLESRDWEVGEEVCIIQQDIEVACGVVKYSLPKRAYVEITEHEIRIVRRKINATKYNGFQSQTEIARAKLHVGDAVVPKDSGAHLFQWIPNLKRPPRERYGWRAPYSKIRRENRDQEGWPFSENRSERLVASYGQIAARERERTEGPSPSSAIGFGVNYLSPYIHFHHSLTRHFALGIEPSAYLLPINGGSVKGMGGLLTFNYYGVAPFQGFWGQLGLGEFGVKITKGSQSEKRRSYVARFSLGYRMMNSTGFTLGLGAGLQYYSNSGVTELGVTFPQFLPAFVLELSYAF